MGAFAVPFRGIEPKANDRGYRVDLELVPHYRVKKY